jgi:hypothetical protein
MARETNYIANWRDLIIAPGGVQQPAVTINSACRRLLLTMLRWDILLFNQTTNKAVHYTNNNDLLYSLDLGTLPPTEFASLQNSFLPPPPIAGSDIFLFEPGQYFYSNIRFDNQIVITMDFGNVSAVNTYSLNIHLHIETIE